MAEMSDFKEPIDRKEYSEKLNKIFSTFGIDKEDYFEIVPMDLDGDTLFTKYMFSQVISEVMNYADEYNYDLEEMDIEEPDRMPQIAEDAVPYSTYQKSVIYVDLKSDLVNMDEAQNVLFDACAEIAYSARDFFVERMT